MTDLTARLQGTPWQDWHQHAIVGDASARQFTRLIGPDDTTAIAMLTPLSEAASQNAFTRIATWLRDQNLCAPDILHSDGDLLVLTDLGATNMAETLAETALAPETLYNVATDILLQLHQIPPPKLTKMTADVAGQMVHITAEVYCDDPTTAPDLGTAITQAMQQHVADGNHIALRDFHAENLIWRPDAHGIDRMGLIDFQDAFIAPAGYDLVSLLRDARRDVSPTIHDAMVRRFAKGADLEEASLRTQLAVLGVQRNLRILGVFARLARQMHKPRYLPMLPRVWQHIQSDLMHPALADLAKTVADIVPDPATAMQKWGRL